MGVIRGKKKVTRNPEGPLYPKPGGPDPLLLGPIRFKAPKGWRTGGTLDTFGPHTGGPEPF